MDEAVRDLFARYQDFFRRSLAGDFDEKEVAELYASEFIAASPAGVMAGKNDGTLVQAMVQGYAHYREIGTREMRMQGLRLSPIDDRHCVAHVSWIAIYARDNLPETAIGFEVHYLVQVRDGAAKVFGWVSGDEQALLRQHGII
ncbi:hypothetical protein SAMN04487972_11352 [Paracoccus halophilus]|uniref:Nuclear transport factor 2 family protein n=1 Tax=Paracoccus halophilus TaxID=376733 RepID=A0A099F260_9RHOB|nr:hypothetical protein [Paracoccus halophilus]KGJ04353.1 hypothetical protein IT41_10650 [Paracoccus halophilus]SFA55177.1 hypothetical protein SAMN04487972_11352 [Paracoccus halophilus]